MSNKDQRRMLRKMKFISDQARIMTRYLREKENWQKHIQNCHRFISESFQDPDIKSVAVLGSGWLLDLPLKQLAKRFEKVLLVDIHHPPQVRKKLKGFGNVKLQELDITGGGIEFAWNMANRKKEQGDPSRLNSFNPETPSLQFEPDAIISLNILNQLDILIVDYLKTKFQDLTENDLSTFRRIIQEFHINWITQKPGCLISDVLEENRANRDQANRDRQGKVSNYNLLHTDLPKSFRSEQWTWDFDLSGFYHSNRITKMKVQALEW